MLFFKYVCWCSVDRAYRTRTKQWNPSVMISSITDNCIPAIVCSQHTRLVNRNRMCCYRSSHTFPITDLFAAYHTHLVKLTVSVLLAQRKQFIRVNCMPYIAHTFIWLPVSIVLPHQKYLIQLRRTPRITHATKIWTVFDVSFMANVLHLFWQFLHHRLRLMHHTQFRQKGLWS